ncbi:carbonyl reductase [NADPH] 1-like [Oscarella lobularis]|uniref:carbonyl reductase [NADPH] 1-like n=1 Tax=Oscarella lobularis TaxID=121494 RepID=UPI003314078A
MSSQSRVAIITGANRGIGYAIVKALASAFDGDVLLTARNSKLGEKAAGELNASGLKQIKFYQLDVTDESSIELLRKHVVSYYGGVDVLVNNAGVLYKTASTVPLPEQARETVKVNFTAVLNLTKALMPFLRSHSRVVNVSSQLGKLGKLKSTVLKAKFASDSLQESELVDLMNQFVKDVEAGVHIERGWPPESSAYYTTKIGLNALTKILAKDAAALSGKEDILINTCCPGWVKTEMSGPGATKSPDEGAETPVYLATLPQGSPAGKFFYNKSIIDF